MGCSWASVKRFCLKRLSYVAETHMGMELLAAVIPGLAVLGGFSKILSRTGRDRCKWRRPILVF